MSLDVYLIGGEDVSFSLFGKTTIDTATTAARRTGYSRCSMRIDGANNFFDGPVGIFSTTLTSFWFSVWRYQTLSAVWTSGSFPLIYFRDGLVNRLWIGATVSSGSASNWKLYKRNAAGTDTLLYTSGTTAGNLTSLQKIDVQVSSYGASGTVNVWIDGVQIITYTGDLTTDSSTSLSAVGLGSFTGNSTTYAYFSECICCNQDTRSMAIHTIPPAADGNSFAWSGSYASVDETSVDDSDVITSSTNGQRAQTTISSSLLSGSPAILGVAVSARAAKGLTGLSNMTMTLRVNGTDYDSANVSGLSTHFSPIANFWELNPDTSGAWAASVIKAAGFNIGVKAVT